jgi:DNA polymerase III epsilon subunit-like protein
MATETSTKNKINAQPLEEYKALINEHSLIAENEDYLRAQIQEVDDTVKKLEEERKKHESYIANAGSLLVSRKATTQDITNKRRELFCLHGALDDQAAVKDIYLEKLAECPSIRRNLRERIQTKEREIKHLKMQSLVQDIIKKNGDDLKQLIALVTELDNYNSLKIGDRENVYQNIGALLCSGIYGGGIRNTEEPGYPSPDEIAANLEKFNKELGI